MLSARTIGNQGWVQSGYSPLKVTVMSNLSAPAVTLAIWSYPWVLAHWNLGFSPLQAFHIAVQSSASTGVPSPQTAFGFSLKWTVVGSGLVWVISLM